MLDTRRAHCDARMEMKTTNTIIIFNLTLHNIFVIVSAIATGIAAILSFSLAARHIRNFARPQEQKQIIRIIISPAVFALLCLLSVDSYSLEPFLMPLSQLHEAFAMVCMFFLLNAYVDLDASTISGKADTTIIRNKVLKIGPQKVGEDVKKWMTSRILMVFQILPVHFGTLIVLWVLNAVLCPTSKYLNRIQLLVQFIATGSTITALVALYFLYSRLKAHIQDRTFVWKLFAFKAVVAVEVTQRFSFNIGARANILKESPVFTHDDYRIGLNNTIATVENVAFAVLFFIVFRSRPYRMSNKEIAPRRTVLVALGETLNISDLVPGLVAAFKRT